MIDDTLLAPEATDDDVARLAKEAGQLGVGAICISPSRLPLAPGTLAPGIALAAVVGFPSGAHPAAVKAAEAAAAVAAGATEIDMVIDLGAAMDNRWAKVTAEVAAVRAAIGPVGDAEGHHRDRAHRSGPDRPACQAAEAGGADFVKTSTGFHPAGGATVEAVAAMAAAVGGRLGVKASGGIRTTDEALAMIAAGATRIGTSHTAAILTGCPMSDETLFDGVGVIRAKREGGELTPDQIRDLMRAYMSREFAEEQMSALLMAIFWRGMTPAETAEWTGAMIASGERADLSGLGRPSVDKHSTGGVGDKLSLIIVPLVAVFGAAVPQMSGRGLGHTGGTLDKLESIPGWRAGPGSAALVQVLEKVGGVITAAGAEMAPADRRLYALRDITATVESIPLIASSIMSKKVAEGTQSLLLDIKVGTGAFMTDLDQARLLGSTMIGIGQAHGVRTAAMLTAMDTPLGRAVGNAVEVAEALDVLGGGGPDDVRDLSVAEAEAMLRLAGLDGDPAKALADGRALDKFREMIRAQGGDPDQPLPDSPVLGVGAPRRETASSAAWTRTRSAWPPGAWEPGGPAPANRCRRRRA